MASPAATLKAQTNNEPFQKRNFPAAGDGIEPMPRCPGWTLPEVVASSQDTLKHTVTGLTTTRTIQTPFAAKRAKQFSGFGPFSSLIFDCYVLRIVQWKASCFSGFWQWVLHKLKVPQFMASSECAFCYDCTCNWGGALESGEHSSTTSTFWDLACWLCH